MTQDQLAELSRFLYSPDDLLLYFAAAFVYLYALTTTVGRRDERERRAAGPRSGRPGGPGSPPTSPTRSSAAWPRTACRWATCSRSPR
jgi:hypothetical protein